MLVSCLANKFNEMRRIFCSWQGRARKGAIAVCIANCQPTPQGLPTTSCGRSHARRSNAARGKKDQQIVELICETGHCKSCLDSKPEHQTLPRGCVYSNLVMATGCARLPVATRSEPPLCFFRISFSRQPARNCNRDTYQHRLSAGALFRKPDCYGRTRTSRNRA